MTEDQPPRTGHPAVDEVLHSMERIDELPLPDQVAAFEGAHESLRRSLSGAEAEPAAKPE